ncbi:MAG: hypothetical protein IKI67_01180, partial [Bacteroidales bacterium]|nr:hypothetical protein [Bacteroidales bacterium]
YKLLYHSKESSQLVKKHSQIWSIPNLISLFRLLLIPLMVGLYFKAKTIAIMINKDALPKAIRKKLNIK